MGSSLIAGGRCPECTLLGPQICALLPMFQSDNADMGAVLCCLLPAAPSGSAEPPSVSLQKCFKILSSLPPSTAKKFDVIMHCVPAANSAATP